MNETRENEGKGTTSSSSFWLQQLHTAKVILDVADNLPEPTNLSSLARKHHSHTTHLQKQTTSL